MIMPRSIIDLISATLAMYRANFAPLVLFSALVIIPITVVTTIIQLANTGSMSLSPLGEPRFEGDALLVCGGALLVIIGGLLQVVLVQGVITRVTADHVSGQTINVQAAFQAAQPRLATLATAMIYAFVVILALSITMGLLTVLFPLLVALFGVVVYIGIALTSLLPAVIMLEDQVSANEGLARAYDLGRARFWTLFGIIAAMFVLSVVTTVIVGLIAALVVPPTPSSVTGRGLEGVLDVMSPALSVREVIISMVVNIVLAPLLPIAMTLFYRELRTAPTSAPLDPDVAISTPTPTPSARGSLFTQRDSINAAILTVLVIVFTLITGDTILALLGGGSGLVLR